MEYRFLGRTGVKVSRICLGTVYFGTAIPEDEAIRVVSRALEHGINFFDTAENYMRPRMGAAEETLGKALYGRRDQVVLATKVRFDPIRTGRPTDRSLTRRDIMRGIEISLKRLGTDYVDLYYPHHPDPDTPLEESLRAFDDLVRQGKVRYVGLSNYGSWQLVEALWVADRRHLLAGPVCVQSLYNLLDRSVETELLPACARFGVSLVPFSPLAGGVLTGKYPRGMREAPAGTRAAYASLSTSGRPAHVPVVSDRNLDVAARLKTWAARHDQTAANVAIAWVLRRPEVASVIMGATHVEQLDDNAPAYDLALSADESAEVEAIAGG